MQNSYQGEDPLKTLSRSNKNVNLGFIGTTIVLAAIIGIPLTAWFATRKLPTATERIVVEAAIAKAVKTKQAAITETAKAKQKALLMKIAGIGIVGLIGIAMIKQLKTKKSKK